MLQGAASLSGHEAAPPYERHRPEQTLLYQIVEQHYPRFLAQLTAEDRYLPDYVQQEFTDYLKCGRLEHGFLRVRCESCHYEKLVAFSCKRRGFCPRCGARRMVESAALLVDEVLPKKPIRQWVLTVPFPLRFLFASYPELMSKVLGIVARTLSTHLAHQAGFKKKEAHTGVVTLIQRFGSAPKHDSHIHRKSMLRDYCHAGQYDKQSLAGTFEVVLAWQSPFALFSVAPDLH